MVFVCYAGMRWSTMTISLFCLSFYSAQAWGQMLCKNVVHRSPVELSQELLWMGQNKSGDARIKLSFAATLYHVERESNSRIFQNKGDGQQIEMI